MCTVPSESRNQPSGWPAGSWNVASFGMSRHVFPSVEVRAFASSAAFGNWMSMTSPTFSIGTPPGLLNALTSTASANGGRPLSPASERGRTCTTAGTLNAPPGQVTMTFPSDDFTVSGSPGVTFFCTGGGWFPAGPGGAVQIVKWEITASVWPPEPIVPLIT